jgi:hypothetical protein
MKLRASWLVALAVTAAPLSARAQGEEGAKLFLLARAAGTYRRLVDIPIYAAEFEVGGGWSNPDFRHSLSVQLLRGRTEAGLVAWGFDAVYRQEWNVGERAWLGFSGELGTLWFERVTRNGTLRSGGIGTAVRAGYDVVCNESARAGPDVAFDLTAYGETIAWGPTLGFRLAY